MEFFSQKIKCKVSSKIHPTELSVRTRDQIEAMKSGTKEKALLRVTVSSGWVKFLKEGIDKHQQFKFHGIHRCDSGLISWTDITG